MNTHAPAAVHTTAIGGLTRIHQGKVRDVYAIDGQRLLIVATDRLSAFDVVLPDPIPGKGVVLNQISNFWFGLTSHIIPNHLLPVPLASVLPNAADLPMLEGRSVVARRLKALPVEAVVRGYLIGSGWKDYQATGAVCGITLPAGLRQAEKLPQVLFTPATKAAVGDHDENISYAEVERLIGPALAARVRDSAIALYRFASEHAAQRGILIADTKFEFGLDTDGTLYLIDEALTPDSSRFWPMESYRVGISPPSFDKQYVRDYLETLDWNKCAPGPRLPAEVIEHTAQKYREALRLITGPAAGG
ncbi:MAG: phosphoribosylaminoimidazolesuccinocarboxamide synthase [Nevskiaceae bacterium]|jgi:phosphoribosylaminoimidazole-succinocarboxamide synthase|nr:phosphoribosylaminoimidazolesuccinocarboxamide synthase [Nevskiaceae bacterium]